MIAPLDYCRYSMLDHNAFGLWSGNAIVEK